MRISGKSAKARSATVLSCAIWSLARQPGLPSISLPGSRQSRSPWRRTGSRCARTARTMAMRWRRSRGWSMPWLQSSRRGPMRRWHMPMTICRAIRLETGSPAMPAWGSAVRLPMPGSRCAGPASRAIRCNSAASSTAGPAPNSIWAMPISIIPISGTARRVSARSPTRPASPGHWDCRLMAASLAATC